VAKADDVFTVFISHKLEDHALAVEVKKALEGLAPGLIDCFVSGTDITAGTDWRREIRSALVIEDASRLLKAGREKQAVEKVKARQPEPKKYDLVLDSGHLALTIHESCGHPTELDRALGYEANYAGTSFLTPEKLNNWTNCHRYSSPKRSKVTKG
jgi:predicted Zn-dependent protease